MGTHFKGTTAQVRALNVLIKLLRAAETISAATRKIFQAAGLSESRFGVLEALYFLGPLTPGELGTKILKSPGNLTLVIDNLLRDGLVERCESANDRRHRPVRITTTGRRVISDLFPDHVRNVEREMASLSPAELDQLEALLKKLGTAHQPEEPGPKTISSRSSRVTASRHSALKK